MVLYTVKVEKSLFLHQVKLRKILQRAATVDKPGILLGGDLNVVMPNEEINSAF